MWLINYDLKVVGNARVNSRPLEPMHGHLLFIQQNPAVCLMCTPTERSLRLIIHMLC
jgi:hypothetical protein